MLDHIREISKECVKSVAATVSGSEHFSISRLTDSPIAFPSSRDRRSISMQMWATNYNMNVDTELMKKKEAGTDFNGQVSDLIGFHLIRIQAVNNCSSLFTDA